MMREAYIKPEARVHEMEAQQRLAGSGDLYFDGNVPADDNELMW